MRTTTADIEPVAQRRKLSVVLSLLGRGVIAFHPKLVECAGGSAPALMLSQALYWTRVQALKAPTTRDGWFWKTQTDWTGETGLSRHEQSTARKRLLKHAFWLEQRRGMPAKIWFRVDLVELAKALDSAFTGAWDWSDQHQLLQLLGRPLIVYRGMVDVAGSIPASVLLSRMLAEVRLADRRANLGQRPTVWHRLVPGAMLAKTGLTRSEFYRARTKLRSSALLHERKQGVPPQAFWRLDLDRFARLLEVSAEVLDTTENRAAGPAVTQFAGFDTSSLPDSIHKSADFRIQECGFSQTGFHVSGNQDFSNPANKIAGFDTPRLPDSKFPYKGLTTKAEITSKNPPPTPSECRSTEQTADAVGGYLSALIWPKQVFLPAELGSAEALLSSIPVHAQTVLDELAGQFAKGVVRNPMAYLQRLTTQAQTGHFIPVVAARVAAQRERSATLDAARAASVSAVQQSALNSATEPPTAATRAARIESLAKLRIGLGPASAPRNKVFRR